MSFFSTGNRLYQNTQFREIPERGFAVCVLGVRTRQTAERAHEGLGVCGPRPEGGRREPTVHPLSLPASRPFCRGGWSQPRWGHGGIEKASPVREPLKVCSSVPPCSLPGLMRCGSPEAAGRRPMTSSLHLQTQPFRSAQLFGADTLPGRILPASPQVRLCEPWPHTL